MIRYAAARVQGAMRRGGHAGPAHGPHHKARGPSLITETVFDNRFTHVLELGRMGADIHVNGHAAVVRGPTPPSGAIVMATDLRASASLVRAGLVAEGPTEVRRVYHLDRGYEALDKRLRALGATIERFHGAPS